MQPWMLITGGSRGIGRGLVRHFAGTGFHVVYTYRQNDAASAQTCADLEGTCEQVKLDVCQHEDMQKEVARLLERRGAPASVILNAGITRDSFMLNMKTDDWQNVIDTNLTSTFFVLRELLPAMVAAGTGTIILISSVAGLRANPGQTNYSATKAGLNGLARSLASEVGPLGIRVNTIAPGFIDTDMISPIKAAGLKNIRKTIPLRRVGSVEDVVNTADFLVSAKSSYITGQTIVVDGGMCS